MAERETEADQRPSVSFDKLTLIQSAAIQIKQQISQASARACVALLVSCPAPLPAIIILVNIKLTISALSLNKCRTATVNQHNSFMNQALRHFINFSMNNHCNHVVLCPFLCLRRRGLGTLKAFLQHCAGMLMH